MTQPTTSLFNPVPVLFLDNADFVEQECLNPTSTEIEEVVDYIQTYFIDDGTFDQVVSEAISHIKAKRKQ
jgi:hypothetical protein